MVKSVRERLKLDGKQEERAISIIQKEIARGNKVTAPRLAAEIWAPESFSVKYRCPDEARVRLEISPCTQRSRKDDSSRTLTPSTIWLTDRTWRSS